MSTEVLVAIIAATVSFVGLVISKESKISDFRQAWINELRIEFSKLFSGMDQVRLEACKQAKSNGLDVMLNTKDVVGHIWTIKLMLNPREEDAMIGYLDTIEAALISNKPIDDVIEKAVRSSAQGVLKKEWVRVKKGEPWFKWTKLTIIIVIVLTALYQLHLALCN